MRAGRARVRGMALAGAQMGPSGQRSREVREERVPQNRFFRPPWAAFCLFVCFVFFHTV